MDMENDDMNSQKTGLRVASVVFAIFAIGHIVRLLNHARVTVGTYHMPMGISVAALIIAGALCVWLWRLSSSGA
jgi:hypothetical protein